MKESLIQKITCETVEKLKNSGKDRKEILLVFMGGDREVERSLGQISELSGRGAVFSAYMTPAAQRIIGRERVLSSGVKRIVEENEMWDRSILDKISGIIVPVLTLNGAAKTASMIADNAACNILLLAFRHNIKIIIAKDAVICCGAPEPPATSIYMRKINEYLNTLRNFGAVVVSVKNLAREASEVFGLGQSSHSFTGGIKVPDFSGAPCGGDVQDCIECGLCVVYREDDVRNVVNSGADRISAKKTGGKVSGDLARLIDHTLLNADATTEEIKKLCDEARQYRFATVCVNPSNVRTAKQFLKDSGVGITTVVGFPLGATTPTVKAIEARDAIANGADEIDMVLNVGALKSGNWRLVEDDIKAVREAAKGKVLKVILETALLDKAQIKKACQLSKSAGADFVKTSTGFGPGGAKIEDIMLMRETVGPSMGVKASGGVRSAEDAREMVEAGATRIGASASVAIAGGKSGGEGGY